MAHPEGSVDAARDIEVMELELTLADLAVVEKRYERMVSDSKKGNKADPRELELLGKAKDALAEGKPLRSVFSVEDRERLKGLRIS